MESGKNVKILSNIELNIKIKLSALWITLMFLFVYADLKAIYQTGIVEAIIQGEIIGLKINEMFLLSSSILMSIPAIMIILSIILKPILNRIFNIIFSLLFIIVNTGTYFAPGKVWLYYIYFTSLEYIICIIPKLIDFYCKMHIIQKIQFFKKEILFSNIIFRIRYKLDKFSDKFTKSIQVLYTLPIAIHNAQKQLRSIILREKFTYKMGMGTLSLH